MSRDSASSSVALYMKVPSSLPVRAAHTVALCRGFDRESLINYRRELIAFSRRDLVARRDYDFRYGHAHR
jgi:hypothetical protein